MQSREYMHALAASQQHMCNLAHSDGKAHFIASIQQFSTVAAQLAISLGRTTAAARTWKRVTSFVHQYINKHFKSSLEQNN